MPRVKQSLIQARILQKRGLSSDAKRPTRERFRPRIVVNPALKTTAMLLKEVQYNRDIEDMLTDGPLHCQATIGVKSPRGTTKCGRCIQCRYLINYSTASKWRKRLGIGPYHEESSQ